MEVIKTHIQSADVELEVGAELSVLLPTDESAKFEGLFAELEQNGPKLGVGSFGLSATTMEEVFLSSKLYLLQSDLSVSLSKIDTCSMMYVIELGHFLHIFYLICVVELSF